MKHRSLFSLLGILTIFTVVIPKPVSALKPAEISAQAKTFTIQIDGAETGSGIIVEQNGNNYKALTCWHVVDTPGNYEITTEDGIKHRVERVQNLANVDLAVVEFSSENDYSTAQLGDSNSLVEGSDTFVVGYPDPIPGIPERTYRFTDANIISQLSTPDNGYQLIHSAPLAPGSSGGAILDSDANLVGINGATTFDGNTNTAYGLAIPLEFYLNSEVDLAVVEEVDNENILVDSTNDSDGDETPIVSTYTSSSSPESEVNNQDTTTIATNITTPNGLVHLGKEQIKQIRYKSAIATFDRALVNNPNNIEAHYGRGEAHFRLGDFDRVVKDFDRVLELNPQDAQAYFYRAYAKAELNKYRDAIADFGTAIELNPNDVQAYISRASVYSDREDYQNALVDLTEAISINPESFDAYYDRGLIYQEIGDYTKAIDDYTKAIYVAPDQTLPVLGQRAIAYFALGNDIRGIQDLQRAATSYFNQREIAQSRRIFDALKENAQDYVKEKLEKYSQAIESNPDDPGRYKRRGTLYNKLRESKKAIADYSKAIELDPTDEEIYNYRAWLYDSLDQPEEAIADYSKQITLNPQDPATYNNRGIVYNKLSNYSNAIDDFDRAIELHPDFITPYLNRAVVYENLERYQKAIKDLQVAAELFKKQMKSQEYLEVVEDIQYLEENKL